MSESVFTKVRKGEMDGVLLYEDDKCFVILSIAPHNPGHMLLMPIEEVADWQEINPAVFTHMMQLAQKLGKVIKAVYGPPKVALSCVGFEVPHAHIHIFSLFEIADIDHTKAKLSEVELIKQEAPSIVAAIKKEGIIQ